MFVAVAALLVSVVLILVLHAPKDAPKKKDAPKDVHKDAPKDDVHKDAPKDAPHGCTIRNRCDPMLCPTVTATPVPAGGKQSCAKDWRLINIGPLMHTPFYGDCVPIGPGCA